MGNLRIGEWRKIPISLNELCINTTLRCGQSFRWRKSGPDEWSCTLHGRILTLKQDSTHLHYRAIFPSSDKPSRAPKLKPQQILTPPPSSPASALANDDETAEDDDTLALLHHYLNLSPSLTKLYADWSAADSNFRRRAPNFTGIRILKQDPWEALCGFICSSNNNIARISQMMHKLCIHYGPLLGHLEHRTTTETDSASEDSKEGLQIELHETIPYHDFPPPEALTGPGVEAHLRELGFGYRAKYIYQTACVVANEKGGIDWLEELVNPDNYPTTNAAKSSSRANKKEEMPSGGREGYRQAHEALLELQGVGPKVADCVCLMGLGWSEAVPVDTHVWQIAQRDYNFRAKGAGKAGISTLTKATYDAVGDKFRALWGKEAGWAHSVLFTADLRAFANGKEKNGPAEVEHVKTEVEIKIKKEEESPVKGVRVKRIRNERIIARKRGSPDAEEMEEKPVNVGLHEHEPEIEHADMMSRVKRRRRSGRA